MRRNNRHARNVLSLLCAIMLVISCATVSVYANASSLEETASDPVIAAAQDLDEAAAVSETREAEMIPEEQPKVQPEEQPDEQPKEQPEVQPDEQPEEQPDGQPDEQPEEQPDEQSEEQPEEQPDGQPEIQPDELSEELLPSWTLQYPATMAVPYGANELTLNTAKAAEIENLGEKTIYLTIRCDCVFTGKSEEMPVVLYVDGVPVTPGEAAVYGTVTASGASYAEVTLEFTDDGWNALSSGSYSMTISYHSYAK